MNDEQRTLANAVDAANPGTLAPAELYHSGGGFYHVAVDLAPLGVDGMLLVNGGDGEPGEYAAPFRFSAWDHNTNDEAIPLSEAIPTLDALTVALQNAYTAVWDNAETV